MFLALTADQRFVENGVPTTLLGEWCRRPGSSLSSGSREDVVAYVFDDRARLFKAYRYIDSVYKNVLPKFEAALNRIHGTTYSTRYWEILAGYWLREYLEVLYERYACVLSARDRLHGAKVRLLSRSSYWTLEDGLDFERRCVTDLYNHQLYSQIIEHLGGFSISHVEIEDKDWKLPGLTGLRVRAISRLKDLVRWISLLCSRWNRIYFCATYFSPRVLLGLAWRLRLFPTVDTPRFRYGANNECNVRLREELGRIEGRDEFERLICATLPDNTPRIYVENFGALKSSIHRFFPKRTKLIATANAFSVNEGFKLWAAEQAELYKTPYVIMQHGGHYGCGLWNSSEDYETRIADQFLTYGWDDRTNSNVTPFYASRLPNSKDDRIQGDPKGDIMWVLVSFPRYSYTMYSVPVGPQFRSYLEDQAHFLEALGGETRRLVKCRPYSIEYGWSDMEFIRREVGPVTIEGRRGSILKRLHSVRLFVCTYNATAHLESMAANVPTLLYWNPAHWEIRDSAKRLMDALHSADILHYTPEDAARKVEEIRDDTMGWWAQPEIQKLRADFCNVFARTSAEPAKTWADWFERHGKAT